jgi:hypothetical protein
MTQENRRAFLWGAISLAAASASQGAEFTIRESSPETVVIEARFIPVGTVVQLGLFSDHGASRTIDTTPLEGCLNLSDAAASVTLPSGSLSWNCLRASWKQPSRGDTDK